MPVIPQGKIRHGRNSGLVRVRTRQAIEGTCLQPKSRRNPHAQVHAVQPLPLFQDLRNRLGTTGFPILFRTQGRFQEVSVRKSCVDRWGSDPITKGRGKVIILMVPVIPRQTQLDEVGCHLIGKPPHERKCYPCLFRSLGIFQMVVTVLKGKWRQGSAHKGPDFTMLQP